VQSNSNQIDKHYNEHYNDNQIKEVSFMAVKNERITILASTEFKAFLHGEASSQGVSVSELIRERCMKPATTSSDEELLKALVEQVNISTAKARNSLSKGLRDANKILKELKASRVTS